MRDQHTHGLKTQMRLKLYEGDKMVDVTSYEINNGKDATFRVDGDDSQTYCIMDCQYVLVYGHELKAILDEVYNRGIEVGRRARNKKIEQEAAIVEPESRCE